MKEAIDMMLDSPSHLTGTFECQAWWRCCRNLIGSDVRLASIFSDILGSGDGDKQSF